MWCVYIHIYVHTITQTHTHTHTHIYIFFRTSTREVLQLLNNFSNMASYKINSKKKLVPLLYMNDKWSKKEIREITHFTIATM